MTLKDKGKYKENSVVYFPIDFNLNNRGGYVFNKQLNFYDVNNYKGQPLLFLQDDGCFVKTVTECNVEHSTVYGIYTIFFSFLIKVFFTKPATTETALYVDNRMVVRTLTETEFELYKRLTRDCFHGSVLKNIVESNKYHER